MISSCKKETPPPEKDFFNAKIDGALVEFTFNLAVKSNFMVSKTGKMMRIVGDGPSGTITMFIDDYKGTGEYIFNGNQPPIIGSYIKKAKDGAKEELYILTEGAIGITSVTDDKIKGLFYFKAIGYNETIEKTISEGKFSINITKS
jgi:hypothetical protein